ncbi:hypothetical protein H8356DRAFT_1325722 [Neocallimastix lanati (nom. inval.)]|nr:hypothetical protein H8356DRAFT_1325722 [Neocallimastix sp. JGI-2020a]
MSAKNIIIYETENRNYCDNIEHITNNASRSFKEIKALVKYYKNMETLLKKTIKYNLISLIDKREANKFNNSTLDEQTKYY